MGLPRVTFDGRAADAVVAMDSPVGFFEARHQTQIIDFGDDAATAPVVTLACATAMAVVSIGTRPSVEAGSVIGWLRHWVDAAGLTASEAVAGEVGGLTRWHPAAIARCGGSVKVAVVDDLLTPGDDGEPLAVDAVAVAVEDGGRMVLGVAMCDASIAADYLPTLELCVRSMEVVDAIGPTLAVEPDGQVPTMRAIGHDPSLPPPRDSDEVWRRAMNARRDAALGEARPLVDAGAYDEAERVVWAADDSIHGAVAIGGMYVEALREAVAMDVDRGGRGGDESPPSSRGRGERGDRGERVRALFDRALRWRQSAYPEPHTAVEAADYDRGRAEDLAELIGIVGRDPR